MPKESHSSAKKRTADSATAASGRVKSTRQKRKKHVPSEDAGESGLQSKREEARTEYGKAKSTQTAYKRYVDNTLDFVAKLVKARRDAGTKACHGIPTEKLADALSKTGHPNRYSAWAIEMYITEKCLVELNGYGTAEGIHAAWVDHYKRLDANGRYEGPYVYDEDTDTLRGNPANARKVKELVQNLKTRGLKKGEAATRLHAEAMSIGDLQMIIRWSEGQSSPELLNSQFEGKDLVSVFNHGLIRNMVDMGFTLWTRMFELCNLQRGDITLNQESPAPYKFPYHHIKLEERKGWQKNSGWQDAPRETNTYELYEEKDVPEADVYKRLPQWLAFLERHIGRPLEKDDYVFPSISVNGLINPKKATNHESAQKLLNGYATSAGVTKYYTTHCLRRGGAQYRFMFAPVGKRWSLSTVRWWGGWAVGEHVDTLMKYLMDSLQKYETGHSDALRPVPKGDPKLSFMGEHKQLEPVTHQEVQCVLEDFSTTLRDHFDYRQDCLFRRIDTALSNVSSNVLARASSCQNCQQDSSSNHPTYLGQQTSSAFGAYPQSENNRDPAPSRLVHLPSPSASMGNPSEPARPVITAIPGLPRGPKAWLLGVAQWNNILKDWPEEYYTGKMATVTGVKYHERKLVATVFERCKRDEEEFLRLYPAANTGWKALVRAIQATDPSIKRRTSKNGSFEERGGRRHSE